jgi:MerR family transcriptional regulator, copper efflux regulator
MALWRGPRGPARAPCASVVVYATFAQREACYCWGMRISELAQRTGVTVHALRHYERVGLLAPARTPGGYRDYPASAEREVVFIAMSRRIGFSLATIGEWLPAYRSGRLTFNQLTELMQARIDAIDAQIGTLQTQRAAAVDHIAWIKVQQARARQKKARATAAGASTQPAPKPWPKTPPTPPTLPRKPRP